MDDKTIELLNSMSKKLDSIKDVCKTRFDEDVSGLTSLEKSLSTLKTGDYSINDFIEKNNYEEAVELKKEYGLVDHNLVWIFRIKEDSEENIYFCGITGVCKMSKNNELLWVYNNFSGGAPKDILINKSGEIITYVLKKIYKISQDGNLIWEHTNEEKIEGICLDQNGDILYIDKNYLKKISDNGEKVENIFKTDYPDHIKLYKDYLYISYSRTLYLYNIKGELLWKKPLYPNYITGIKVYNDVLYVCGMSNYFYKMSLDGKDSVKIIQEKNEEIVNDVHISENGNTFIGLADGTLIIKDKNGETMETIETGISPIGAVFAPNNKTVFCGGRGDKKKNLFRIEKLEGIKIRA